MARYVNSQNGISPWLIQSDRENKERQQPFALSAISSLDRR